MVNTQLLEEYIDKSGKKKGYLAKQIGVSTTTFRSKSKGDYPFDSDEIEVLCEELSIRTLKDKERVFFAPKVDKSPT